MPLSGNCTSLFSCWMSFPCYIIFMYNVTESPSNVGPASVVSDSDHQEATRHLAYYLLQGTLLCSLSLNIRNNNRTTNRVFFLFFCRTCAFHKEHISCNNALLFVNCNV